jgi:hypothetical protein
MRLRLAKRSRWIPPVVAALVASPLLCAAGELESSVPQDLRLSEERDASRSGVPQAAPTPAREPVFELVGVVNLEGDASFALLQEPELTMGRPLLIRQGQSIGVYRLVAVEDDRVRLESPTGMVTVLLGGSSSSPDTVVLVPPKPEPEARQAPRPSSEPSPKPAVEAQDTGAARPMPTAEESVQAALNGTRGEKVLKMLKNALGLGVKQ